MSELVDPVTGELLDFEPRPGDESYAKIAAYQRGQPRRRWGNRVFLTAVNPATGFNPFPKSRQNATVVATGDLGRNRPVFTEMRFAMPAPGTGSSTVSPTPPPPVLPFTKGLPFAANMQLTVNVRRGVDPLAPVTQDAFQLVPSLNTTVDMETALPFDTWLCRSLGIDIQAQQFGPGTDPTGLWIETQSTVIEEAGTTDRIIAAQKGNVFHFAASLAGNRFLNPNPRRVQFIIQNTSTDGDLYIAFKNIPITVADAAFVLPKNSFATYESPIGGWGGIISGLWVGGVPNGAAFITELAYEQ